MRHGKRWGRSISGWYRALHHRPERLAVNAQRSYQQLATATGKLFRASIDGRRPSRLLAEALRLPLKGDEGLLVSRRLYDQVGGGEGRHLLSRLRGLFLGVADISLLG